MIYTIKYRCAKGTDAAEIEASNREAALAEARRRKLSVISVTEGGTGKLLKPSQRMANAPLASRGIIGGLIIIAVGSLAIWLLSSETKALKPTTAEKIETHAKTSLEWGTQYTNTQAEPATEKKVGDTSDKKKEDKEPGAFKPGWLRLPNGTELRFRLPAEGDTRQLVQNGVLWEVDSKGNIRDITPPPLFATPFEQSLSDLIERDGMALPFALKGYSEKEVIKMCKEPTFTYDDDTPDIITKRLNVANTKKAILEYLEGGGKFSDYVDDMVEFSHEEMLLQSQGVTKIHEMLKEGRYADARAFSESYSKEMESLGYSSLRVPSFFKRQMEENVNEQ